MASYDVYKNESGDYKAIKYSAVAALVLGYYWLLFKGFWGWFFILIGTSIAASWLQFYMKTEFPTVYINTATILIISVIKVTPWFLAWPLLIYVTKRQMRLEGFTKLATVKATDESEAIAKATTDSKTRSTEAQEPMMHPDVSSTQGIVRGLDERKEPT